MAVRGAKAKQDITQKILETFSDSFVHEKEIRIPYVEDGISGEIKVTLTAAKVAVGNKLNDNDDSMSDDSFLFANKEQVPQEPTEEEKERLKMLLEKLGI